MQETGRTTGCNRKRTASGSAISPPNSTTRRRPNRPGASRTSTLNSDVVRNAVVTAVALEPSARAGQATEVYVVDHNQPRAAAQSPPDLERRRIECDGGQVGHAVAFDTIPVSMV